MRGHGVTHGPHQSGQKQQKMANIDFFMEKSENGKDNDKALEEIIKIYAVMYGKGGHDY